MIYSTRGSTERTQPAEMTKEHLQAARPRCQRGLIPLLERPRVLVLSRAITQFYMESFISKELEMLLHQNVNYRRHSHHRDETCLLSRSSCLGHSQSVQNQGETAGWAASGWHPARKHGACTSKHVLPSTGPLQPASSLLPSHSLISPGSLFPDLP